MERMKEKVLQIFTIISLTILFWAKIGHANAYCGTCLDFFDQNPKENVFGYPDINSYRAIPVDASPLVVTRTKASDQQLCNNGRIYSYPILGINNITLTGGPLCGATYQYLYSEYDYGCDIRESIAITIDGRGFPFEGFAFFFNEKYSPETACGYSDGLVVLVNSAVVGGYQSNDNFTYFNERCREIRTHNTCTPVNNGTSLNNWWYPGINSQLSYYALSTQYYDAVMFNKNCKATFLVFQYNVIGALSIHQFHDCFLSVANASGKHHSIRNRTSVDSKYIKVYQYKGFNAIGY